MRDGGFVQGLEYFRRNNWRLGEPDLAPLGRESLRDVDGRGTASSGPVRAYDDMPIDSDMDFDADDMRSTRSGAGGPLPSAALSVLDARVAAAAGISGPALTAVRELDAQRMESAKIRATRTTPGMRELQMWVALRCTGVASSHAGAAQDTVIALQAWERSRALASLAVLVSDTPAASDAECSIAGCSAPGIVHCRQHDISNGLSLWGGMFCASHDRLVHTWCIHTREWWPGGSHAFLLATDKVDATGRVVTGARARAWLLRSSCIVSCRMVASYGRASLRTASCVSSLLCDWSNGGAAVPAGRPCALLCVFLLWRARGRVADPKLLVHLLHEESLRPREVRGTGRLSVFLGACHRAHAARGRSSRVCLCCSACVAGVAGST